MPARSRLFRKSVETRLRQTKTVVGFDLSALREHLVLAGIVMTHQLTMLPRPVMHGPGGRVWDGWQYRQAIGHAAAM